VIEIFGMSMYSIEIYIIKNIHSYSSHFLGSHISFIGFLWHFGLKFLLKHSWDSLFLGDQMDLFSKPVYIPSIPLNIVYKPI
jgi:hypothetical protein